MGWGDYKVSELSMPQVLDLRKILTREKSPAWGLSRFHRSES